MLTFLRKIRKSLIESGSARKYLLYAIGEIALVVIGILIALQINNWNEERISRISELNALVELNDEFQDNRDRFIVLHEWKIDLRNEWKKYLEIISDESLPKNERAIPRPTNGAREYNISNSALSAVLNSDRFENIENDSLKYLLTQWGTDLKSFKSIEDRHEHFVENTLRTYEYDKKIQISYSNTGVVYTNPFLKHYSKEEIKNRYLLSYEDLAYQNMLFTNIMWLDISVMRGEMLSKKINKIIELLTFEIKFKEI